MTSRLILFSLILLAALSAATPAQMPAPAPVPVPVPTPLLALRFAGPQGMRATFYQGRPEGRAFDAPVEVGMRIGYIYRVKLSGLAKHPGVSLYPSLEIRGCLQLPPGLNPAAYPVPIVLTEEDIEQALNGTLVTKVIYLENPARAASPTWKLDEPLERALPANLDPWAEAWSLGRPLLILRLGEREVSPEELAVQSLAGTILHPGERVLPAPRYPPCVPLATPVFFDPRLGPKPSEDECLRDGGDQGLRAGLDSQGKLHGLEPEDTVARYADAKGRVTIVPSNRICICVPRFAVLRTALPLGRADSILSVGDARTVHVQSQVEMRQPSVQTKQYEQIQAIKGREKPSGTINTEGVGRVGRVEVLIANNVNLNLGFTFDRLSVERLTEEQRVQFRRQVEFAKQLSQRENVSGFESKLGTAVVGRVIGGPQMVSAELETRDFTIYCIEPQVQTPDRPLTLYKWADRCAAQVGDVVTIFLRFTNHGNKPITDVAVSDSLTGRLEYVAGTAQSDCDAVFTAQPNEAGSLILHWEVGGTLQPGQSGVVRFQARIR